VERVVFTKEMKDDYTILIPNMAPIHFQILIRIFSGLGYKIKLLQNDEKSVITEGIKHVNNDTCYPALLVIGQIIDAIKSSGEDLDKVAVLITQTGGGCRASNYIHLLRKALANLGMGHIPVISLNLNGLEVNPGFEITSGMVKRFMIGLLWGDILMHLSNQTRPYEIDRGQSDKLLAEWIEKCGQRIEQDKRVSAKEIRNYCKYIVKDFTKISRHEKQKIKVGIVGEIYIKYSPLGNNHLEDFLKSQDVEIRIPTMLSFALYNLDNVIEETNLYGGSLRSKAVSKFLFQYVYRLEKIMNRTIGKLSNFDLASDFHHTKSLVNGVIGTGFSMGEGWLLTAEMIELTKAGFSNIICVQPFGCLPNHINGKGMLRKLSELLPEINVFPIDYDANTSKVNQENRIKLMLAIAQEKLRPQS